MARFTRHHAGFDHTRWLSLIDVSGPFLSLPVLRRTWPSLDALDRNIRERLRLAHAAFPERPWIDYVLTELLEWGELVRFGTDVADLSIEMATYDTTLTPSFALLEPGAEFDREAKNVRLLGLVCDGHPHRRINDSDWPAPPVDRLAQLCRHHDVEFGLATDGRWWAFIWAPRGGVTTTATFDSANWHESAERDVVRAFLSILGRYRFFGVPDDETLPVLLKESLGNQEDITEALGVQVRQAVELLVAAIGRAHTADVARGGPGIGDVEARDVYRGAVAVMIRIIFVLFAEERGYLPADKPLYRASYSAGLLCTELEQRARDGSEEDLEHTYDGWHRLVALFNAICNGVEHPDVPVRGYDGSIFDDDRYAWLPLTIDDRTVLHMLQAVQYVHIGTGKSRERRRLSFRTVTVEEIGYVYEGLLSFDAFYADETFVCLTGKPGLEDEVPLRVIEGLAATCPDIPSLGEKLAVEYKKSGIGSARALAKRLQPLPEAERQEASRKLLAVTRGDYPLTERLLPFFGIIRRDLRGLPVVILTDGLYVTESRLRKNTGAHYTPRFLAEEVVEGALEPLVYFPGPLQTANEKEWRHKSSADILSLKVADIAVGSGAFLVAACRYLANHLVTAWIDEGVERARDRDIEIEVETLDADADPVVIEARRRVIEHCLYGADINDMAVDMAKLSLWLVSMDPSKPFTFLDDRLIVGDSLLGITSLDQLKVLHMDAERGRQLHEDQNALFSLTADIRELVERITRRRRQVVEIDGTNLGGLEAKRTLLAENSDDTEYAWFLADLATGAALAYAGKGKSGLDTGSKHALTAALRVASGDRDAADNDLATWLRTDLPAGAFERQPIQWPLAFPEVFSKGGFDAVIGNPPFLGGTKITGTLGIAYREELTEAVAGSARAGGRCDLVAYFALRAHTLLNPAGQVGLVATNTLAQGDTREVGLDRLLAAGVTIRKSVRSRPWPSKWATLEYCIAWTSKAPLSEEAHRIADGAVAINISGSLESRTRVSGIAHRLAANQAISFEGVKVTGMGFILDPKLAAGLIEDDRKNAEVLVTGQVSTRCSV